MLAAKVSRHSDKLLLVTVFVTVIEELMKTLHVSSDCSPIELSHAHVQFTVGTVRIS